YIGFIGNTQASPETQVITRDLREKQGGYIRIFINDGRISGASILNCLPACMPLTKLVQAEARIDEIRDRLADPETDLAKLSAEILQAKN
ncbi:MAG: oxidoreductase C-terminal domain-containing protein, partial [Patescibacteria group bacterium]